MDWGSGHGGSRGVLGEVRLGTAGRCGDEELEPGVGDGSRRGMQG